MCLYDPILVYWKGIDMFNKDKILCLCGFTVFIVCLTICLLNLKTVKKPFLQQKTDIVVASVAKYQADGNIYVIDKGSFRVICMDTAGNINYTIDIDMMEEYTRFYDMVADRNGNLYLYMMEAERDALYTKKDTIRRYDNTGKYIEDIAVFDYSAEKPEDRPHIFARFGGLKIVDDKLLYVKINEDNAEIFEYNILNGITNSKIVLKGSSNYEIAQLVAKDLDNYIFTTRSGEINEVIAGANPTTRASFSFDQTDGGFIPWYLDYGMDDYILFCDMFSNIIYSVDINGELEKPMPTEFFRNFYDEGRCPSFTNFGFADGGFAGVFSDVVWFYNGKMFSSYDTLNIPAKEKYFVFFIHLTVVLGIMAFLFGLYKLYVSVLDRRVSLFVKQTIVLLPISIIATIILFNTVFGYMSKQIEKEIFNELNLAASIGVEQLDGDMIEGITSTADFGSERYNRFVSSLKNILNDNKDDWNKLYYSAVYKMVGDIQCFVYMSNDSSNLFRPYGFLDENSDEKRLLDEGIPFSAVSNYVDGIWAFANVPIYNSKGNIVAIFEIGVDLLNYQIQNDILFKKVVSIGVIVTLVLLIAIMAVTYLIVGAMASLKKTIVSISGGDYNVRTKYLAKDELGDVGRGLNFMAEKLQAQLRYISELNESTIRFVPWQFMEQLGVNDITKLKLGDNVQKNYTTLFCDIRAFSINSEMMTSKQNFHFVNEVLGIAGPIVRENNGFVDKYLGDAIMALFSDANDAMRAGIELYKKLILDDETRVMIGNDGINVGIGLHTGSVMMGIVGENERLSSTVISNSVNMASRVESLTKQTKSGMLITRDTMNELVDAEVNFSYRFIGMIQVAGVNEVKGMFDILDALPPAIKEKRLQTKELFESGIRMYHMKEYATAAQIFQEVLDIDNGDICAQNCLNEAKKHIEQPHLTSVFVFDKK